MSDLGKSENGLLKVNKDLEQKQCIEKGCMGKGCMGQVYYCYSMSLRGCSAQCVQVSNLGLQHEWHKT